MEIDYDKDFEKVMTELQTNFGRSNIDVLPESYRDLLNDTIKAVKNCSIHDVLSSATSKDYSRLFDKISKGEIVPCFVDYDWRDGTPASRDIAKVQRHKENSIMVGVRGMQYGGVDEFALDGRTELKAFTDECERMNLEYFI